MPAAPRTPSLNVTSEIRLCLLTAVYLPRISNNSASTPTPPPSSSPRPRALQFPALPQHVLAPRPSRHRECWLGLARAAPRALPCALQRVRWPRRPHYGALPQSARMYVASVSASPASTERSERLSVAKNIGMHATAGRPSLSRRPPFMCVCMPRASPPHLRKLMPDRRHSKAAVSGALRHAASLVAAASAIIMRPAGGRSVRRRWPW